MNNTKYVAQNKSLGSIAVAGNWINITCERTTISVTGEEFDKLAKLFYHALDSLAKHPEEQSELSSIEKLGKVTLLKNKWTRVRILNTSIMLCTHKMRKLASMVIEGWHTCIADPNIDILRPEKEIDGDIESMLYDIEQKGFDET